MQISVSAFLDVKFVQIYVSFFFKCIATPSGATQKCATAASLRAACSDSIRIGKFLISKNNNPIMINNNTPNQT